MYRLYNIAKEKVKDKNLFKDKDQDFKSDYR